MHEATSFSHARRCDLRNSSIPCTRPGGNDEGGPERHTRAAQTLAQISRHQLEPVAIHQIGLREHRDAAGHAKMLEDGEVLERLRHDAFVGRDHEQGEIHA